MILTDLNGKLDWENLFSVIRTKLNGTLVTYENMWYLCAIADEFYEIDGGYLYGDGPAWLYLNTGNHVTKHALNTIEEINTEPEWPEAGYYYSHSCAYNLCYYKASSYKAGLSPNLLGLEDSKNNNISTGAMVELLNEIAAGKHEYPDLESADQLLWNTDNKYIPVGLELTVGAHPYVNGPVLIYKDRAIGRIDKDTVVLNNTNAHAEELLTHMGVKYICQ